MNQQNALIIFAKNLIGGKVKTRLADTIGNDKALEIYKKLIDITYTVTENLVCDKLVFYSEYIEENDCWNEGYAKLKQQGNDLGKKMANGFEYVFQQGYLHVLIIGTDCPSLNEKIINNAFELLNNYDVIIGPAADGGYYLLGLKKLYLDLFENIEWSTDTVLDKTITVCNKLNLKYFLLPVLHDIDKEKDLKHFKLEY